MQQLPLFSSVAVLSVSSTVAVLQFLSSVAVLSVSSTVAVLQFFSSVAVLECPGETFPPLGGVETSQE